MPCGGAGAAACGNGDIIGGVTAATGGWVSASGRFGAAAAPDCGARLIAPPAGGSGTEAGGTGGGRSLNNCAAAG